MALLDSLRTEHVQPNSDGHQPQRRFHLSSGKRFRQSPRRGHHRSVRRSPTARPRPWETSGASGPCRDHVRQDGELSHLLLGVTEPPPFSITPPAEESISARPNNTQMAIAGQKGRQGRDRHGDARRAARCARHDRRYACSLLSQFGSTTTTDSNSLKVYNGSGFSEIFAVGNVNNFVQGSAVGSAACASPPDTASVWRLLGGPHDDCVQRRRPRCRRPKRGRRIVPDRPPTRPENKYLYHSFVESPYMKNVYDGNITTNKKGLATVVLPTTSKP